MSMLSIAWIVFAFLCGSLPFSIWVGRIFLHRDVRQVGDGNPGAANVFRSGSSVAGVVVLLLDVSKAAVPVGLAYFNLHPGGTAMFLIAIAPVLGHSFSPFLGFKGGKAIAASLGVWIGLTVWKASLPAVVIAAAGVALFTPAGWSVMFAMAGILVTLLIWLPVPLFLWVWPVLLLILAWNHRSDLRSGLHLRPWLAKRLLHRQD